MPSTLDDWIRARDATVSALLQLDDGEKRLLRAIEDQLGKVILWPAYLREMFLSSHLRFNERFKLTLFLLGNALPPTLIVKWYVSRKMLKDDAAHRNVAEIIKMHMDGTLEERGYLVYTLNATKSKPYALREHRWDGVGEDDRYKLRVRAVLLAHVRNKDNNTRTCAAGDRDAELCVRLPAPALLDRPDRDAQDARVLISFLTRLVVGSMNQLELNLIFFSTLALGLVLLYAIVVECLRLFGSPSEAQASAIATSGMAVAPETQAPV